MRIQSSSGVIFNNRIEGKLGVSRAIGDIKLKQFVIPDPEGQTWPLTPQDDLLILSSDGLYNSYSQEYVVKRILELRAQGLQLGQIAQCVLEECISLENTRKHCYDNVTLLIVSLSDYLREFESLQKESLLPQLLALRKMDSESCIASREEDLADVSHSIDESASL